MNPNLFGGHVQALFDCHHTQQEIDHYLEPFQPYLNQIQQCRSFEQFLTIPALPKDQINFLNSPLLDALEIYRKPVHPFTFLPKEGQVLSHLITYGSIHQLRFMLSWEFEAKCHYLIWAFTHIYHYQSSKPLHLPFLEIISTLDPSWIPDVCNPTTFCLLLRSGTKEDVEFVWKRRSKHIWRLDLYTAFSGALKYEWYHLAESITEIMIDESYTLPRECEWAAGRPDLTFISIALNECIVAAQPQVLKHLMKAYGVQPKDVSQLRPYSNAVRAKSVAMLQALRELEIPWETEFDYRFYVRHMTFDTASFLLEQKCPMLTTAWLDDTIRYARHYDITELAIVKYGMRCSDRMVKRLHTRLAKMKKLEEIVTKLEISADIALVTP